MRFCENQSLLRERVQIAESKLKQKDKEMKKNYREQELMIKEKDEIIISLQE